MNPRHHRATYPPAMTPKDALKYTFHDTTWIWRAKTSACDACLALNGKKFYSFELPDTPHPNCKCVALPTKPDDVKIYGRLPGFESTSQEIFTGKNKIEVTLRNTGAHMVDVQFEVTCNKEMVVNRSVILGRFEGPVTVTFSELLDEPVHWDVFMRLMGSDGCIVIYSIKG